MLLAWVAIAYAPSLTNGFTYDDSSAIKGASALLSQPSLLPRVFSTDYFRLSNESTYRPVVTLTYMLDWQIGGGSPWVFHVQSLLWHLVSVGCILLLLKRLRGGRIVRYASAAFYGVHPVLTEAVDSIAFREDVLVTALGLVGLLLMIDTRPRRTSVRVIVSSAFFAAAMFAKESAVVFVVLLPLTRWAMAPRASSNSWLSKRHLPEYLSLSVCTLAYLIVRFVLLPSPEAYGSRLGGSLASSLATGTVAVGYYLRLLVYPHPLSADYRGVIPFVTSGTDWRFWMSAVAIAGLTWVAWLQRRENRLATWGWLWFLAALSPVTNVIPMPVFMAERFLPLPFVGLIVFAVSSPVSLPSRTGIGARHRTRLRYVSLGVTGILLVALSDLTSARHDAWSSNEVLWRTTLEDHPTSYGALHGYGVALIENQRYAEAVPYLQRALDDSTIDARRRSLLLLDLGSAYLALGQLDTAKKTFEDSLAATPDGRAYFNLGLTLIRLGRAAEAADALRAAVRLVPEMAEAHAGLGAVFAVQGKTNEAIAEYREAVRLKPPLASAHANLGIALAAERRTDEAIDHLETALRLDPTLEQARETLQKLTRR